MATFRQWWGSLGRPRAVWVVAGFFAIALAGFAMAPPARDGLIVVLTLALVAYCFARSRGGWAVFLVAAVPGVTGARLHDLAGAPAWAGLALVPFALLAAWRIDRAPEPGPER